MSIALPIERDTRERDYAAEVGQTTFGFDAPLLDGEDLQVWARVGLGPWARLTTGYTVTIAGDQRSASVAFTTSPRPTLSPIVAIRLRGARVADRGTDVTRGGAVKAAPLELEFDRIALTLQELRRDADTYLEELRRLAELVGETDPDLLAQVIAARAAAQLWATSPDPIPVSAGGDGVSDHSAKYWAEIAMAQTGDNVDEITAEVDFVALGNVKWEAVLGPDALLANKEFTLDGFAVDDGKKILCVGNIDKTKNRIGVYDKANNQILPAPEMPIGSTIQRPYAVRVNEGRDYTDAVFLLDTYTGIIGTTQLNWINAETATGAVGPNYVLAGSPLPSGYPRQSVLRRLVQGDMPLLRPSPAIAQWEPVRPAIVGLKVRKLSTYGQEATKWSRQVSIAAALDEGTVLEIDEPCYLSGLVSTKLSGKTIICHGPSVPFIQRGPVSSIFDLAGAYDFTIRGHMHARYVYRSSTRAIRLLSPNTCGRFRLDLLSTENVDYGCYFTGAFTGMVRIGEIRCKDYATDTALLMTQTAAMADVPKIGGKPVVGSQELNATKTYQWGIDPERLTLSGAMTASRTLTLSPNNAFEGARCKLTHAATGGFSWNVQYNAVTIATLSNGQSAWFLATAGGWILD